MKEELERLNKKLKQIRRTDPISQARKITLIRAIYELQQRMEGEA